MTNNEFKYKQLEQARNELTEQQRHSLVSEAVERGKLSETIRHQQAQEAIDKARNDETIRHDYQMEALQNKANAASQLASEARMRSAAASETSSRSTAKKTSVETKLMPAYYGLESKKTNASTAKSYSDINVNERNASTNELRADTERKKWMTDTVLAAGNFATNALGGAVGNVVKVLGLL